MPSKPPEPTGLASAQMAKNFNPDQVKIIQDAYKLAKKTFESSKPLTKIQRDLLAREIVTLAGRGCLETERLASRAIMRVMMWSREGYPPAGRASPY
jgi:hypothetical protein